MDTVDSGGMAIRGSIVSRVLIMVEPRLTIGAIRAHELEIAAIVLTETMPEMSMSRLAIGHHTSAPRDLSSESNLSALTRLADVPTIESIPYTENLEDAADALRELARRLAD